MSTLAQFLAKKYPLGATISMPYAGNLLTEDDGSVWLAHVPGAAFAYSATYANAPSTVKCAHPLIPGPVNSLWPMGGAPQCFGYKAASTLFVVPAQTGDNTNGGQYYTSSDVGVTWTTRTFPNSKYYQCLQYTAGKFVGVAASATTNGVITSTDGVTWTSVTGVSMSPMGVVSDGGNNIVIWPSNGTGAASSTDGGTTWASRTLAASPPTNLVTHWGACTWNAGAGLFVATSGTSGAYQTSPTGVTWTNRASQSTFSPYNGLFTGVLTRFASNATVTVAVGSNGFFATTTDGLTWANHGYIANDIGNGSPGIYHDGTRFVAIFGSRVFYSVGGTAWTEAAPIPGTAPSVAALAIDNGVCLRYPTASGLGLNPMLLVTDVTLTTPQTIVPINTAAAVQNVSYTRIA